MLEHGDQVVAIEVKATSTPTVQHTRHMAAIRDRIGPRFRLGIVLHTGPASAGLGDRMLALPISAIWNV